MAQHGIFGKGIAKAGGIGAHLKHALAAKCPAAVDLHCAFKSRTLILRKTALPRKQPCKAAASNAFRRGGNARLQNSEAVHNSPLIRAQHRAIERMQHNIYHVQNAIVRNFRVGIQRQNIANPLRCIRSAAAQKKSFLRPALSLQKADQIQKRAAFALPAHKNFVGRAERAAANQQQKARAVFSVQSIRFRLCIAQ